jgi:hypothetical protein
VTNRLLLSTVMAASILGGVAATENDARADVSVHIGGHAHVRVGGPRVRYRIVRRRPAPVRVHVGGTIWVGGGYYGPRFAPPPPPPSNYCDCDDGGYYGPVRPAPSTAVYTAPVARAPLPRFGIGIAAGGVDVEGQHAGSDLALFGRYRLTPGLAIEGEIGKNELADGQRVDRRLGASLLYELGAYNKWAPYGVAGIGVSQVDVGDGDYQSDQSYAEIGVGLRLALTRKLHVAADIRAGSRDQMSSDPTPLDAASRSVTPVADESEEYTRMRLSAMLYF